jgi:7SK snRNA methylphosphate capping enzyme
MLRQLKNEKYKYGNYDDYYKQRNINQWIDPRLQFFSPVWFNNRSVLDIGCNNGTLSILISSNFAPASLLGIDIDRRLINQAVENTIYIETTRLKLIELSDEILALEEFQSYPLSFQQYLPIPKHISSLSALISMKQHISLSGPFPNNISFLNANYLDWDSGKTFDTILCLSTIKWVHLNWGDEGVKSLFQKVHAQLNHRGIFVFEPQPWKSYKKARSKTQAFKETFHKIRLRPEDFEEYLISLGFIHLHTLTPASKSPTFKRPILVYMKSS